MDWVFGITELEVRIRLLEIRDDSKCSDSFSYYKKSDKNGIYKSYV